MGGVTSTTSTVVTDAINNFTTSLTSTIENNCKSSPTNLQEISLNFKRIEGCSPKLTNMLQTMGSTNSTTCNQINVSSLDVQNALIQAVDTAAETLKNAGSLELLTIANSTNVANLKNFINNEVNMKNLSNAINSAYNRQSLNINLGTVICYPYTTRSGQVINNTFEISNLSQKMVSDSILNATQSNSQLATLVNSIDQDIKQKAKTTATGIGEAISAASYGLIFIAIIILAIGAKNFLSSKGGSSGSGSSSSSGSDGEWGHWLSPSNSVMYGFYIFLIIIQILAAVGIFVYYKIDLDTSPKDKPTNGTLVLNPTILLSFACIITILAGITIFSGSIFLYRSRSKGKNSKFSPKLFIVFFIVPSVLNIIAIIIISALIANDTKNKNKFIAENS